ncbi:trypsin-like serine peptidase [Streptomyces sp. NBC_00239]|uniref:trypsin-like serine peptidase n=1 Tax=Streptomyces sp. NBC_00239 TaxID=2903640 RepID=UPI002E2AF8A2|nr:trypsin-like serine protease [Streptomyces sp. NBC_00239]
MAGAALITVPAAPAAAAAAAAAPPVPAPASVSTSVPASAADWTSADAARFWTPERMATATPAAGAAVRSAPRPGSGPARAPYAGVPAAATYAGSPAVGVLYYVDSALATHSCTASVVQSPKGNLIVTAAHCSLGTKTAFVPQYRTGVAAGAQPYGIWAVDRAFRDNRHTAQGPGSDLDFAFATVKANPAGRQIQQLTGGNKLTRTPGYAVPVTVIGYPNSRSAPADKAVKCRTTTTRLTGYKQLRFACAGYYGGTSGSPFLMNYDERTRTGDLVGNLGGWNGGGLLNNDDAVSFSPLYDAEVFDLYDAAVADRAPTVKPKLPDVLGGGETWAHARHLVSGEYTGDGKADLITVWTDGEVTLYTGDGRGGYTGETRLAAPNTVWAKAVTLTGGEFTGGGTGDLIARWPDGSVTLNADAGAANKLGRQTRLQAPNATWKHAVQIAAGRWSAGARPDDLVVRWSDGEVSLYSDVSATVRFSREKMLYGPNPTWKNAAQLLGGDFTGANGAWDLMVRWADGKRTVHPDVGAAGIRPGTVLKPASAWGRTAMLNAAGNHTANGRPDDLLVLWADGRLSSYPETGSTLGAERLLVPPKVR